MSKKNFYFVQVT